MKLPKFIKPLSGVLCIFVLAAVVMLALYLDSLLPDPIFGVFHPEPVPEEDTVTSTTVGESESTTQTTTTSGNASETQTTTTSGDTSETQTTTASGNTSETQTTTASGNASETQTTTTSGNASETQTTTASGDASKTQTTTGNGDNVGSTTQNTGMGGGSGAVTTQTSGTGEEITSTTAQPTKTEGDTPTTQPTQPEEEPLPPPEVLPPVVDIPTEEDPETGETEIAFPCQVPGYDLVIERLAPYRGMFVEDGTNATVENVAMLLLSNKGDHPVEYAQIAVRYGEETLLFDVSALPAGEQLVVQEKNGKSIPNGKAEAATAMVVRKADLEMSRDKIEVIDNGNNTLTIRNLTDQMIPTVRVFYKYYMEDEDVFVGGIAFTVRITRLDAQGAVTIQPSHYSSQTGRVVMVLTYDSEV